ncbi:MAG TPA: Trp biosynthesis-associated membrane protein [Streptosporangiaceae bacterium]
MPPPSRVRRQFVAVLLLGAAGAGLALLALRPGWARAVYDAPRPLPSQSITLTGQDLVPAAGALALAGLACLAAVIATRGVLRRAAGVVLALCGAGTAIAAGGSLSTARIVAAASSKVSSSASVASGGTGSTTGGTAPAGGAVVTGGGSAVHTIVLGVPWRVALFAGAAALIAAGLLTLWRGPRWPVMSGRYERQSGPARFPRPAPPVPGPARPGPSPSADLADPPDPADLDQAALWDSISRGDDPTAAPGTSGPPGGQSAG